MPTQAADGGEELHFQVIERLMARRSQHTAHPERRATRQGQADQSAGAAFQRLRLKNGYSVWRFWLAES